MAKKKENLSPEEMLEQALAPECEWPYIVPENWAWVKCTSIIEIMYGKGLSTKELKEDGYPVFGANGYIGFHDMYMFNTEQVLMSCRGAYSGAINTTVPYSFVTNNSLILKSKINEMNYKFIAFMFESLDRSKLISGSAQPQVTIQAFESFFIPLPPLAEQLRIINRIENLFEKLDQAKGLIQDALDSFENRKAAILHKAFCGELTKKWREENGVGMESWEQTVLKDLVDGFKYGTSEKSDYRNSGIPVLRIPNVILNKVDFLDLKYLVSDSIDSSLEIVEDDLLIIRSNGSRDLVGKCALVPKLDARYTFASYLIRIRSNSRVLPRFLIQFLNSGKAREQLFSKSKSSAGINNINSKELGSISLNIPTISEQYKIVNILEGILDIEERTIELMAVIENIEVLKKSILSRAFHGELGTNDPTDESALLLLKSSLKHII